jgi:hypothetical protein
LCTTDHDDEPVRELTALPEDLLCDLCHAPEEAIRPD